MVNPNLGFQWMRPFCTGSTVKPGKPVKDIPGVHVKTRQCGNWSCPALDRWAGADFWEEQGRCISLDVSCVVLMW